MLVSCSPIRGCLESSFTLTTDSRLPKWFTLPTGYTKNDVTVYLAYYSSPLPVDNAVIQLRSKDGKPLVSITGQHFWHPETEKKRNKYGGFDPGSEPHFVIIRAKGITEVIEHKGGPTFNVSDDLTLIKQAIDIDRK